MPAGQTNPVVQAKELQDRVRSTRGGAGGPDASRRPLLAAPALPAAAAAARAAAPRDLGRACAESRLSLEPAAPSCVPVLPVLAAPAAVTPDAHLCAAVLSAWALLRQSAHALRALEEGRLQVVGPSAPLNTKGYSSTHLAMGLADVRAGTQMRGRARTAPTACP